MADATTNPIPEPQAPQTPPAPQPSQQVAAQSQPAASTGQAPQGFVPPAGQVPPQQPFGPAPAVPPQPMPQNMPGMPLLYLTGGMKFGWAVLGFFMGPIAILIAWLTNAHNFPQARSEAVKFSLIGFLVTLLWVVLLFMLIGFSACAAVGAAVSYY